MIKFVSVLALGAVALSGCTAMRPMMVSGIDIRCTESTYYQSKEREYYLRTVQPGDSLSNVQHKAGYANLVKDVSLEDGRRATLYVYRPRSCQGYDSAHKDVFIFVRNGAVHRVKYGFYERTRFAPTTAQRAYDYDNWDYSYGNRGYGNRGYGHTDYYPASYYDYYRY